MSKLRMEFYNPFNQETYSKSMPNKIKRSYHLIDADEKYQIYANDDYCATELVYMFQDEELGKRLYPIIKKLKENEKFYLSCIRFYISKIVVNPRSKSLLGFYLKIERELEFEKLSRVGFLNELRLFLEEMKNFNYVLEENFPVTLEGKCRDLATFILLLREKEAEEKVTQKDFLEYTHVYFQEEEHLRSIEELFESVTQKGIMYRSNIHYSNSMLQVYYEYYTTKIVPNNFLEKLENEIESRAYKTQYLTCECQEKVCYECKPQMILFSRETLEKQYAERIVGSEYTQYRSAGNELYDCVLYSMDQKEVTARIQFLNRWYNLRDYIGVSIVSCIFDLDNQLIGYMYSQPNLQQKFVPIKELIIREDRDIHWIKFLWSIDINIRQVRDIIGGKNRKRTEEIFDLEKIILSANSEDILFNNESSFMRISYAKGTSIQKSLGRLALLLYAQYIRRSNVGIEETERNLYHTVSFKILPPIFAAELYQFMMGQDVDFLKAYKSFFEDFLENREYEEDENGLQYIFYGKYILNPLKQDYIFLEEVEEELNQKIEVISAYIREYPLKPDGKFAYISTHYAGFFNKRFLKELRYNEEVMEEFKIDFNDKKCHLHKIGVDKLVYKKEIDETGTYQLYGYIGDQKRHKSLSDSLFGITNKEFLKVAMNLFIYFNDTNKYISLDAIKVDDDFELYVDMQEKVEVESRGKKSSGPFADYLFDGGLSECRTLGRITLGFKDTVYFSDYMEMKQLYQSLDSYCDIHHMWYSSKEGGCEKCKRMLYFLNSKEFSNPVFEDQYANHYDLKDGYYLKIYKEESVDLRRQKENLEEYFTEFKEDLRQEQLLGQELFLPEKMAMVLPEKEFVGYVYKEVDFSECISLDDLQNVTKLKGLLTLCMQLQRLDEFEYKFRMSPFNSIFLHKQHLGVMQLVNIDLLNFTSKPCMTTSIGKMLKRYIVNQLKTSEDLEPLSKFNSRADETVLAFLMRELRDNIEKMNQYCSIHKRFYHQKHVLCPVCFPNFKTSDLRKLSVFVNVRKLREKKKRFEGGEAVLYDYTYEYEDFLAKLFKRKGVDRDVETEVDLSAKLCILLKLFERRDVLVGLPIGCKFVYVLPQFIILDTNKEEISGYLLKEVKGEPISSLRDEDVVERMGFSFTDILEILIAVGEGIRYLHEKANIFIGDLSGTNIMYDRNKVVYFLDFDGMGIDNVAPQFFTDDYVDPNARKRGSISMEDDWYSFAILAFYHLTRVHPFNGIYYQNGRPLEISEKMELRVSLLGDHEMKIPEIARDWKWMEGKLFDTFLGIFEGDLRVDITPYLKQYYNKMTGSRRYKEECEEDVVQPEVKSLEKSSEAEKKEENIPRLTDISHEYLEYSRIVRENVYVTLNEESLHLYTKNGMYTIHYEDGSLATLRDVLISSNERLAFLVFDSKIDVVSIMNGELLRSNPVFCGLENIAISQETLYLAENIQGENVLLSYDFSGEKAIENVIKFKRKMRTKALSVCDNSKFVVIKTDETVDYIFCNDMQFAKIEETTPDTRYRIFYDEASKQWLVLSSNGFYMVIKSDGDAITSSNGKIKEGNLESMVYCKGILYIPLEKNIYAFQPKRSQGKDFPCEVVTQESLLIRKKRGFVISNPGREVYEFVII